MAIFTQTSVGCLETQAASFSGIGSIWTYYPRGDGNIPALLYAGAAVGVIDVAQWLPLRLKACRPQRHLL